MITLQQAFLAFSITPVARREAVDWQPEFLYKQTASSKLPWVPKLAPFSVSSSE